MATYTFEDYTKALDERFGAIELDMGEQGKFTLTRPGRMSGKQKERYDALTRAREALMHEQYQYQPGSDRMMVDIVEDMDKNAVELLVEAANGSKEFRKWLESQHKDGQALVWEQFASRGEQGEA